MSNTFIGRTCPYCQNVIKRIDEIVECPACETVHHRECWLENGRCTTPLCPGVLRGGVVRDQWQRAEPPRRQPAPPFQPAPVGPRTMTPPASLSAAAIKWLALAYFGLFIVGALSHPAVLGLLVMVGLPATVALMISRRSWGIAGAGCVVALLLGALLPIRGSSSPDPARNAVQQKTPDAPLVGRPQVSFSAAQGTSRNLTLEANIRQFAEYLRQTDHPGFALRGRFADYTLVMPPAVKEDAGRSNIGSHHYEIAFFNPKDGLHTFHTDDGGITWMYYPGGVPAHDPQPTDPYIRKLADEYAKCVTTGRPLGGLIRHVDAEMNPSVNNDAITVALASADWGTPPLRNAVKIKQQLFNRHLRDELDDKPDLAHILWSLAERIQGQVSGVTVTLYEYSKRGDNVWVAGEVFSGNGKTTSGEDWAMPRGFICHSADGGKSWARQWFSDNTQPEPVYGIYFSDMSEGWGLTIQGILHTENGGGSWEKVFQCDKGYGVENLFILSKTDLLITTRWGSGHLLYSSRNRGASWEKASKPVARNDSELADLQKTFGSDVHYGGVYSREDEDQSPTQPKGKRSVPTPPVKPDVQAPEKPRGEERFDFRTWTSRDGKFKVRAKLRGVEDGKAKLEKEDGRVILVPRDRLSEEEQRFIDAAQH